MASPLLSSDALSFKWSVTRSAGASILTCTWYFAESLALVMIGLLSHEDFGLFGDEAFVDFSLTLTQDGAPQRTFSQSVKVSEVTSLSTSASVHPRLREWIAAGGIQRTGLLSLDELEPYITALQKKDLTPDECSMRLREAGRVSRDTSGPSF